MTHARQSGFSLIELAIVIAIIGLLAGGIVGGQVMIENARMNKIIVSANQYTDAKQQFRDRYQYLPGDFPTATQQWGKADGDSNLMTNCSPLGTASPNGVLTCNGNGSHRIDGSNTGANTEFFENFRAWQHMAAAGLISGRYTGVNVGATASGSTADVNVPAGPLPNSAFFIWSWGAIYVDDVNFYAGDYDNAITFGKKVGSDWHSDAALTSGQASGIDIKADDGLPGMGSVRAMGPTRTNCVTTAVAATARYALQFNVDACTMMFLQTYRNKTAQ